MEINYTYISSDSELKQLITSIHPGDTIFIDFEFDKNHFRYGFNLCLVQLYFKEKCYLIDPLNELSIEQLFPVFEQEDILKVCFSFGEDLRLLHYLGCFPKGLIDLSVVRSLLNKPVLSLTNLISEVLGHDVGGSQQKSNWFLRPLTKAQCIYAAEDVVFLSKLYQQLMEELESHQRVEWLREEMNFVVNQDFSQEPVGFQLKAKDRKEFKLWEWMRYEKLIEFRERIAIRVDRPSYKVINKNYLIDLAKKNTPVSTWEASKHVYPSYRNKQTRQKVVDLLNEVEEQIKRLEDPDLPAYEAKKAPLRLMNVYNRKQSSQFKETFFDPLRPVLKEQYGEHFVNFAFSNRRIEAVCRGELELLPYQKTIFKTLASQFKLSVPPFFG